MATAEITRSASPSDSKKRKSQIDEIEVDLSLPEPPSKKAKRLLKKGKQVPAKPNSDDEKESEDELPIPKTKDSKKPQRSEHGIWIGNLAFTVTRVDLFKWLVESSGGIIKEENITRVNLPMSKNKGNDRFAGRRDGNEAPKPQNKGFAYVDFDSEPPAVAAMALTETEWNGRKVLIKNSKSFEGRPAAQKEAAATDGAEANGAATAKTAVPTSRKIYLGNLSFQTTEEDLRNQFDKCGEIDWIKVATFEDSGKCKGYGWIKFREPESAEQAVKGFVKIKEEIETEEDFQDGERDGGGNGEEKKFKMRKWWINRLKGRELKIELAEDDQTRYKKRFGKAKPQWNGNGRQGGEEKENPAGRREKSKGYGDEGVVSYLTGAVQKPQGKKITFD
ncbi:RNA-binding domain-containing protein [Xylariomycetidae sp. FL0641]|nr:RNA-binding domain-containing protein [Xylariomycetidae sp. FL0641]